MQQSMVAMVQDLERLMKQMLNQSLVEAAPSRIGGVNSHSNTFFLLPTLPLFKYKNETILLLKYISNSFKQLSTTRNLSMPYLTMILLKVR